MSDDIMRQAEQALEESRMNLIAETLLRNLEEFQFFPTHIERREFESKWNNHLSAINIDGEIIRRLSLKVLTTAPMIFGIHYPWEFIEILPVVVSYQADGETWNFQLDPNID